MHQGDVAFVDFRLLIQQRKDTLAAGQGHDHRVELHGDLGDGLVEVPGQYQEAGQLAQGQAAEGIDGHGAADDGAQHIAQVAQRALTGMATSEKALALSALWNSSSLSSSNRSMAASSWQKTLTTFWPFIISSM